MPGSCEQGFERAQQMPDNKPINREDPFGSVGQFTLQKIPAGTAWAIASNEIESRHRIDLDATITAIAQTAKDMNNKYKETSKAGLALSVTLC